MIDNSKSAEPSRHACWLGIGGGFLAVLVTDRLRGWGPTAFSQAIGFFVSWVVVLALYERLARPAVERRYGRMLLAAFVGACAGGAFAYVFVR